MDKEDSRDRSRDRDRNRRDRPTRFSDTSRDRSVDRGKDRGGMKSSNCRVYVSNIPYEYRWQDLKDLFRSQVGEVAFVELFVDENDKPRGCGIVEFSDSNSVKKCLECMHRFELKGRKIVIKEDFGNSRDKFGNLVGVKRRENRDDNRDRRDDRRGGGGGGGGGGNFDNMNQNMGVSSMMGDNKWGNTYGLSPAFLEELGINGPLNTRIFVANLEYKVDKKKIKEVFRMAGKVQSVDMPMGKDGLSRGFAVVEFDHPVESVQAISMFHNQPLFDRMMTVRMDRGGERDKMPEGLKSIGPGLGTNGEPLRDVARNLPSLSNNQPNSNSGAGILGAVPNLQLGVNAANALSNLNVGSLGNLTSTSAVLQAANLAGVGGLSGNLLSGGLGGTDLNLAANLVQSSPSLAALAASTTNLNNPPNNFNRSDNQQNFIPNQNTGYNSGSNNSNMGRNNYSSYDSKQGFNFGGNDRDSRTGNNPNMFNNMNNGGQQMMRGGGSNMKANYSKKILISNLPPTASYKMLNDKCQEFGNVQHVEEHSSGGIVVSFQTEWEAERAIKNMDRARIDGRTIDVHFI